MKRRVLCLIIAVAMVLGTMSFTVFAEEQACVAKISDVEYTDFSTAMAAANNISGTVEVEIYGAVEFTDGMELNNGNYDSITFVGKNTDAQITINQTAGGDYLTAHGKTVSFISLILAKANPAYATNSGHMGNYFSVQGGTVTYTNCTFPNGACTSTATATYTDCTFQNPSEYGLWVYDDALVTVNGGTIDSTKGIKVYSEGEDSVTSTLTVQNATFTAKVTAKPAVAIGYAESITLIGNTYNNTTGVLELDSGTDANCEGVAFIAQDAAGNDITSTLTAVDRSNNKAACGVFVTNSDGTTSIYTTVTKAAAAAKAGDKVTLLYNTEETVNFTEGVTVDTNNYNAPNVEGGSVVDEGLSGSGTEEEPYIIADIDDLKWFRDDVNAGNNYSGKVVKLADSVDYIDLAEEDWTPIGNGTNQFSGSFDGNNKTIKNLTINGSIDYDNKTGLNYVGLFGYLKNAGSLKNLTIENADVSGCLYVGTLAGRVYIGDEIENCRVVGNVTVDGYWYVGGLVGRYEYADGIRNCSVEGSKDSYVKADITQNKDKDGSYVGGIVGFMSEDKKDVTNCLAKNMSVSGATRIGGISGIAHYNNTIANCSIENVTVTASEDTAMVGLIAGSNQGGQNDGENAIPSYIINNSVIESTASNTSGAVTTHSGSTINETAPKSTIVGVDVVLDEDGKVTSGTLEPISSPDMVAEGLVIKNDGTVGIAPSGSINGGLVNLEKADRTFLSIESSIKYANESIVIKVYDAKDVLLATSSLIDTGRVILGKENWGGLSTFVGINCTDSWWNTVWEEGKLRADYVPAKATLFIDGVEMNTHEIQMRATGTETAVNWAEVPGVAPAPFAISTVEELQAFAASVNDGNTYEGKTVVLVNNINLMDEEGIVAQMTSIGTKENPFKGTFDGKGYIIDNLYLGGYEDDGETYADSNVGLFGYIASPAVIKNVTVNNPFIVGKECVGGVVGCAYTGKIENCHITGEIDIEGYYKVGGITGYGYAAINNCSVIGAEDWDYNTILAVYNKADLEGDNVGGIIGHFGEGTKTMGNCTVKNVNITGTRKIGGIVGTAFKNHTYKNCTVSNVTIGTNATEEYASSKTDSMGLGGIIGIYANTYQGGTVEDCSVSSVTFTNENNVTVSAGAITGGWRDGGELKNPAVVATGNSVTEITGTTNEYLKNIMVTLTADGGKYADGTSAVAFNASYEQWNETEVASFGMYIFKQSDKLGTKISVDNNDGADIKDANGLFNVVVTEIPEEEAATTIVCLPYVIINNEVIPGSYMAVSASQFLKNLID